MGTSYKMTISLNAGNVTSDQAGKALFLGNGDSLQATLGSGFVAPAKMQAINFFVSSTAKANNTPFQTVQAANAIAASVKVAYSSTSLASVQATSDLQTFTVADAEDAKSSDEHFWFTINIIDGNQKVWTLDPEVINTGGNDPRRGFSAASASDTTQTLGTSAAAAVVNVVTNRGYTPAAKP